MKSLTCSGSRRPDWWTTPALLLFLLLLAVSAAVPRARAQGTSPWWQPVILPAGVGAWGNATAGRHYELDRTAAWAALQGAPLEADAHAQPLLILLPRPDGRFERFAIAESPIMAPELAARYPDIKTYSGRGLDDPAASVRVGWSPAGLYAQVLSAGGSYYVDPRGRQDAEGHVSYFVRDLSLPAPGFNCHVLGDVPQPGQLSPDIGRITGPTLRSYRVAIATTAEFTAFHGGVAGALDAVVQVVNRLTGIYEVEVGARLTLVANNDLILFTNPVTDPFTNADSFSMLFQVQPAIDSIIGPQNYDVGHVFGTDVAPNGVAFLRALCEPSLKGSGVTLAPNPVPDGSWVMVAAHEFGHQFGANHTFNGVNGGCGPNRNATTAYEPGSGSTIMSYSSICGPDNLKGLEMMDPHFHSISYDEITTHLAGVGGACAVNIATSNNPPVISAGVNYVIPARTPFRLTATGSDPDGDSVSYSWEQRDLGPAQALGAADNGLSPLFRVFNPTSSPVRIFPNLDSLRTGSASVGEQLPVLNRTMRFRVTARDQRPAGGGVNTADMQLTVVSNAGPFVVTAPGGSSNYAGPQTVTWNVAGTTNTPINANDVNLWFSLDGGRTFPVLLAAGVPNDGSEVVDVLPIPTTAGRVMVEAAGNVFFDISDTNLTIPPNSLQADLQLSLVSPTVVSNGQPFTYSFTVFNAGPDFAAPVVLTNVLPAGVAFVSASNSSGTFALEGGAVVFSSGVLSNGQFNQYSVTVRPGTIGPITNFAEVASSITDPATNNNRVTGLVSVVDANPQLAPAGAAVVNESFTPLNGVIEAGERVTVSFAIQNVGPAGTPLVSAQLLPGGGVLSPTGEQSYGFIPAGSVVERPFAFTATGTNGGTVAAVMLLRQAGVFIGTISYEFPLPASRTFTSPAFITINSANAAAPYPSTLQVSNVAGQIARVTVTLNKFTHSFPDDVDILLVSPGGRKTMLLSDVGGGQTVTNLVLTLDDAAASALPDGFTLSAGTFKPEDYEPGETMLAPAPAGPYATSMAEFNQQSPNGTWSLYVQDDTGGDAGSISGGWAMTLATVSPLNVAGDLALTLSASTNAPVVGVPFTYQLAVANNGPAVANAVTLTDVLPPGLTLVLATNSQGTISNANSQVVVQFGSLAVGGSASASLTVVPTVPGTVTNQATVSAARAELTPADNSAFLVSVIGAALPVLEAEAAFLTAESLNPPNGAIDPGELVTVSLRLRNVGTADTTNLVATLLAGGGVQEPSGAQNYGSVLGGGGPVARDFSFTAANVINGLVTATLALQDGAQNLGTVQFVFSLGGSGKFTSTAPITILDGTNAAPYPATIVITNLGGVISRVSVVLSNFSHSFPDDVDILLAGPTGERLVLMSDAGGSFAVSGATLTFDDAAANTLPDSAGLVTGTYRPTDHPGDAEVADVWPAPAPGGPYGAALAGFNGISPIGAWSLFVRDDSGGDAGVISGGWSLVIETVTPVSDSADLILSGAVSTNQVVVGDPLTFVFTVTNKGPAAATQVLLTNTVPVGAQLVTAFPSQGSQINVNGQLVAQFGTIERNGAATFTVVVTTSLAGPLTNSASVSSPLTTDFALANNRVSLVASVLAVPAPVLGPITGVTIDGAFEFSVTGQSGLSYVTEASTNLVDWVPISTNSPVNGVITITDPDAALIPERFYRAWQVP